MRPGAARAIAARIQRRVLPHLGPTLPSAVAGTWLGIVDAAAPIDDLVVSPASETVQLRVQLEGDALGAIELAPIERRVSAHAIRAGGRRAVGRAGARALPRASSGGAIVVDRAVGP
jgi:hypothetical protein